MQPKEPSESDVSDEEIQSVSECKGKKGTKQRKPKIPAALALMHGFAATNVGKNRLTVGGSLLSFGALLTSCVAAQARNQHRGLLERQGIRK